MEWYCFHIMYFLPNSIQSCHKFCYKFHVVNSLRQWGGRVERMAGFGLLSLEVLVPRQFARMCRSIKVEWSAKEDSVSVIALHNCRKSHSQIFKLLKPFKISWMFVYWVIIRYKELWGLKTGLCQDALEVWGLKLLSKRWGSWFTEICSPEIEDHVLRAEHINPIDVTPYHRQSTHERLLVFGGTPPYSHFEEDPTDKSRAAPPVACQERAWTHTLHGQENLHHRGAVQPPEWQDLCSNVPWGERKGPRVQRGHHPSYFMVWWECPIRGWHLFIFVRKEWKLVPKRIKRTCYKELWNLLTQPSSMVRNVSSSRIQLLSTRPRRLRSGCRGNF